MTDKQHINMETLSTCILCGGADIEDLYQVKSEYIENNLPKRFTLQRCASCEHVFVNPRPDEHELMKYYPSDCPNYESSHETILERAVKTDNTNKLEHPKKVLDVGFGQGDFLAEKAAEGWECYGTDPSEYAVKAARTKHPKLKLFRGDLKDAKYQDNFFELINLTHVLEHVPFPQETLEEIYRILKPGGRLIVEVPNYGGLYYSLAKRSAEYFVPQHLSFFKPITLTKALTDTGFKEINVTTSFGNNMSYHILHKLGIQKSFYKKSILNQMMGLFIVPFEILLNKGDVIKCKATK